MHAGMDINASRGISPTTTFMPTSADIASNIADEERGLLPDSPPPRASEDTDQTESNNSGEASTQVGGASEGAAQYIKRKASQILTSAASSLRSGRGGDGGERTLAPRLQALVDAYQQSAIAGEIKAAGEELQHNATGGRTPAREGEGNGPTAELPDVALETSLLRGRKRASWLTQFRILSGRAFKNLYRDPALLTAHYLSSIALACKDIDVLPCYLMLIFFSVVCGLFFHNVT